MNENIFDKLDFGPFRSLLDNDDITDISYDNGGQIWIRSLTQGSLRVEVEGATPEFVEKLAFQCSNVMGTTFNNAKPFLDAESAELRMNFVHQSIATNGIALVIRKTPAKIRLEKEKLIQEDYFTPAIHDFLIKCVEGHCNIMVAGETGSGKTEFVKYLASHTKTNEKIITIEDTLELHLDKIFPQRDIVAMKTNNVASYSDVLVTCMRQNPKWILLSEVRSAEAVSAVRNSISSGHNILSTIHADKASAIPYRLYSLMETDLDVHQFLTTIYRYIQLGVHIKAFYSKEYGKFHRELDEVCEFYVDDNNVPISRIIYQKIFGKPMMCRPSDHLIEYIENQNIDVSDIIKDLPKNLPIHRSMENNNYEEINNNNIVSSTSEAGTTSTSNTLDVSVSSASTEDANPQNINALPNENVGSNSSLNNAVVNNGVSLQPIVSDSSSNNVLDSPVVVNANSGMNPQSNISSMNQNLNNSNTVTSASQIVNGQGASIPLVDANNNVIMAQSSFATPNVPPQIAAPSNVTNSSPSIASMPSMVNVGN
ncbi:MAG: type II/IV secretion system ATPase subunit [Bacilli bacterium]|nr:type II/IV secretion system ATPase subunit [Bacilli bacterium]